VRLAVPPARREYCAGAAVAAAAPAPAAGAGAAAAARGATVIHVPLYTTRESGHVARGVGHHSWERG
jgi:hypothetical protein